MKRAIVVAVLVACGSTTRTEPALENKPRPVGSAVATPPIAARGLAFVVVDDSSDYMKRMFQRVGSGTDGAATDPDAIAAGIRCEIDSWSIDDSRYGFVDYYLVAADRGAIERYVAKLAASDPAFRVPDDRELVFENIDGKLWRSYYVFKQRELDHRAVQNATVAFDPSTHRPLVLLDLTAAGARTFEDLTSRIVGKKLATLLDGNVRSAPVIMSTIRGGRLSITMGGGDPAAQEAEAAALVKALTTYAP
jgi:hypothetical protein